MPGLESLVHQVRNSEVTQKAAVLGGTLTLAAATHAAPVASASIPDAHIARHPTLIFDDLNGGSPVIQVYPGVGTSDAARRYNATYNSGDTVEAICKRSGRLVRSHPDQDESERASSSWIKIRGTQGNTNESQYATAVYVQNPRNLLEHLRACKPKRHMRIKARQSASFSNTTVSSADVTISNGKPRSVSNTSSSTTGVGITN